MMEQMVALSFNQSDAGCSIGRPGCGQPQPPAPFTPNGFGSGGQGRGRGRGCGRPPPGFATGRGPSIRSITAGRAPGYMGPPATGGGYYVPPPQAQHVQAPPYSNLTKFFCNLECVLFLRFRCRGRSYQPDVPPTFEEAVPQHLLHPPECAAVHRPRVQLRHKEPPHNGFTTDVTVRGDEQ